MYSSAGLRPIRIHDLRHTAATALLTMGEDSRSLMPIFGWANMTEVQRYAHVQPAVRRRIADAQGRLFRGTRSPDASTPLEEDTAD